MEATQHLVYCRQRDATDAAMGRGTNPRTVPIFDPPCDCAECQLSFHSRESQNGAVFSYVGSFSNSQARSITANFVSQINKDHAHLKATIKHYGDVVLRRWRNRSHTKRAAMLLQVNPSLPKESYARVRLEYSNTTIIKHRQEHRCVNLVPYLDAETLSIDPATMIRLLQYRAEFSPAQWAPFDHHQLTVAWGGGLLDVHFNGNGVVMFGDDYGTLVPWEKTGAHRADIIGFPRARLILEGQAYLMGFLRKLVDVICAGPELEQDPGATNWEQYIHAGLKKSGATYWSDFTFGPFSAPPVFDIDCLYAQAKARLDATADHLEFLQTEPAYMKRYARIIGQMHLTGENQKADHKYQIMSGEITGDLATHWFWLGVCDEFEHARSIYHRYDGQINRGQPLPKEVDDALGALELLLVNAVHQRSMQLQVIISQRPGFSHWYKHYSYDPVTKRSDYALNCSGDSGDIIQNDPLWWCLMQLQGDPEDQTRFPYAMLFQYLDDHLASSTRRERSRLDEVLYEKMSDYATIIELLSAVRMHFPKCTIRDLHEVKMTEDRFAWRRFKVNRTDSKTRCSLATSMKRFLKTPIPSGPRDGEWLGKLNASHEALQNFWKSVHGYYLTQTRDHGYSEEDIETFVRPIRVWNSHKYLGLLASKRDEVLRDIARPKRKTLPNDDLWLPLPTDLNISSRHEIPDIKNKAKTRGRHLDTPTASEVQVPAKEEVMPTHIALTKRGMRVFQLIFPTTPEERQQSLDWDVFVRYMEEAGFKGRGGGGSIVTFEKVDGGGKINVHRPHPDPRLDPVMLQSMGRRIHKWFGWTRNTFKLAGK